MIPRLKSTYHLSLGLIAAFLLCSRPASAAQTAPSAESDCGDVRLDQGTGSVARLQTLNQGSEGLCYAYTATQMIDAWRFSIGRDSQTDRITSPVYGAVLYAENVKKKEIEKSNDIFDSRRVMNLSDLKAELQNSTPNPFRDLKGKMKEVAKRAPTDTNYGFIGPVIQELRKEGSSCQTNEVLGPQGQQAYTYWIEPFVQFQKSVILSNHDLSTVDRQALQNSIGCLMREVFPGQLAADYNNYSRVVDSMLSGESYIKQVFDAICDRRVDLRRIPEPQFQKVNHQSEESLQESAIQMNRLLSRKSAQPVGIGYCSSVLFKKENETCGPHASIVIGRKMIGGRCHFLVRNSWGKTCTPDEEPYAYPCENGQIWVPADALMRSTYQMEWL